MYTNAPACKLLSCSGIVKVAIILNGHIYGIITVQIA